MQDEPDPPRMFPLMLDLSRATVFIIGAGYSLAARLSAMEDYGAATIRIFAADPSADAVALAGSRLVARWPTPADFAALHPRVVFIADIDDAAAAQWRTMAHTCGALVHVQDRIPLTDFYLPAILRRGRLQISVSTDGTAAGLSRLLRDHLAARVFGPEWADRVAEVAAARLGWKREGLSFTKLSEAVAGLIRERGWLK